MNDGVSILVAIFIILLVFRWLLGSSPSNQDRQRRTGTGLATGRRYVSPEQVSTVHGMFPNVPIAAIQADLARTGSVEVTCDNILRDGGLPLPVEATPQPAQNPPSTTNNASSSSSNSKATATNLIHRFNINPENEENATVAPPKVWEATADKRQDNLQRRKEHMILQARKRFLEQQQKKAAQSEVTEKSE
ncbi:hypothetical protein K493DRAFT_313672 [Basidiobolus meristosporus CBS 931.73]|uniref:CUE domain-containing protein n=1 Tax=Basidiobolus meristosporus CBS 931.73 TaxID=1314790 RepID=A0A1Y1YKS3_9FUNG|nr:hypothetical protein K493DRAFT_313672 [Basidiobolus meristosporus CBS 931.73]|eukprot:ORX98336.1 hypothetical protein K493DRAFT_313672 [Basidiobolus meristosporus CBS 931.73]